MAVVVIIWTNEELPCQKEGNFELNFVRRVYSRVESIFRPENSCKNKKMAAFNYKMAPKVVGILKMGQRSKKLGPEGGDPGRRRHGRRQI